MSGLQQLWAKAVRDFPPSAYTPALYPVGNRNVGLVVFRLLRTQVLLRIGSLADDTCLVCRLCDFR